MSQILTAEQIFPQWSEQINRGTGVVLNRKLGWKYGRCIVSESLGWKSPVFCNTCEWYANRLVNRNSNRKGDPVAVVMKRWTHIIKSIDYELYERYKSGFIDHYNHNHSRMKKLIDPEGRAI